MAVSAVIKDGAVVESASQASLKNTSKTASNDMDKDAFLQLLVAEMQYQDPLEPTSNTEYITQYAQFSQVESLSNMASSMDLTRASSLVGKEVIMNTTGSNGESKEVQGRVDYVTYEGNKAYLSINESLYSLDDLAEVVDSEYLNASDNAYAMTVALNKLPAVNAITVSGEGETIDLLADVYNSMSSYEKSFVASDTASRLQEYIDRLAVLRAQEEESADAAVDEA